MIFSLEALDADHGDALVLHYGPNSAPRRVVVDGGPAGVYRRRLRRRLQQMQRAVSLGSPLPVELLMVSHIDDDHIRGVLDMADDLLRQRSRPSGSLLDVRRVWHNSFDDIVGNRMRATVDGLSAAVVRPVPRNAPPRFGMTRAGTRIAASVRQGRTLRDQARRLGWTLNAGFRGPVVRPDGRGRRIALPGGLSLQVLGPSQRRLDDLRNEWDARIRRMGRASAAARMRVAAAYVDGSVANLASIVVIARLGRQDMLLTGDARGDDILEGLREARLLRRGRFHVNVLKVPHHGSDRNVETDFFRAVTARHYVFSGDGTHGNPEPATLQMLMEARGSSRYTMHFTHRERRIERFFRRERTRRHRFDVVYRTARAASLRVDLQAPVSF